MLDSMIQMQLHMQAAQKEKLQEKIDDIWAEHGMNGRGFAANTKKEQESKSCDEETFWERMERIHRKNQKREEMLVKQERYRKQALRKERQEAYEAQLMLRRKRQQALDKQYIMKKVGERTANEKRGSLLMLARSADGRLPVSAEIERR